MTAETLKMAVEHYLRLREQLGARPAAQHVCQRYGVDPLTLTQAVRDAGALLRQA